MKNLVPNVFLLGRDGIGIGVVVCRGVEPIRDWALNEALCHVGSVFEGDDGILVPFFFCFQAKDKQICFVSPKLYDQLIMDWTLKL